MSEEVIDLRGEDWDIWQRLLPDGWQEKARESGAIRRFREFADTSTLLRVLFIHLLEGCSLRATSVYAREGGLADVSAVALFKRLRLCGEWFRWMGEGVVKKWLAPDSQCLLSQSGWRVRVVDGSTVSEPGASRANWRIHYAMHLPSLRCDEVHVTDTSVGESLQRFQIAEGDLILADRLYATRNGIRHVCTHGGAVLIRMNLTNLPLCNAMGKPIRILTLLRTVRLGRPTEWPVWLHDKQQSGAPIAGRLCAIKKTHTAAEKERAKVRREASKKGHQVQPETLEACAYTFVFTTLPARVPAAVAVDFYRGRWQIELAFKRYKSLLNLGHLKKVDAQGAIAWLQGKLLVAILNEAMLDQAERISPWGYPMDRKSAALHLE